MMRVYMVLASLLLMVFAYAQYKGYSAFGDEGKRGHGARTVLIHHK
ncbi:hypothetical protein [Chitinimonas lacunae]|uniref:Uncharacterized protein n=1 Tax=Chitinimonas lacunae TaxID=1963018 RepID=A0ABV8MSP0_9NEIS